jgi:hypothetical protein
MSIFVFIVSAAHCACVFGKMDEAIAPLSATPVSRRRSIDHFECCSAINAIQLGDSFEREGKLPDASH